jgi:2'-5' RNA ligase
MEMIRTFVAIELDSALQTALHQVQDKFKRSPLSRIGRWVSPDGIHLTLKFLGDVPSDRVEDIRQAIERGCHSFAPFSISLTNPGFFPNARKLRVVWVGVDGDVEQLSALQASIESELKQIGFPAEKRGFQPHLTLARIRDQATTYEREEMAKLISTVKVDASVSMSVQKVSLMRSDLKPTGAVYTRLAAIALGKG